MSEIDPQTLTDFLNYLAGDIDYISHWLLDTFLLFAPAGFIIYHLRRILFKDF